MAIHMLQEPSIEHDFDFQKPCVKGGDVKAKSLATDLYTVDTCDTLAPYPEDDCVSSIESCETTSCADDDFSSSDLDVAVSQSNGTFASSAKFTSPKGISDASSVLQNAFLDVERATQLLAQQVQKLGVNKPSELQQFLADVETLKSRFVDTALPQLAQRAAETTAKFQQPPSDSDARKNLVPAQPALSLPDPLGEVLEYASEQPLSRTFAICDVGKLGVDSFGALRRHFSKYGTVDLVIEPRVTHATRFALMRMTSADAADTIATAGEIHMIRNCELSVRRLDTLGSL
eukprot:TRINITY_DN14748_c0_g1_i3.p1 TRINITY_DN14748_c0_g1~~TRINITY_DN14748_c0_g1_i3.p1  ORF type:complete len:309 (-),score=40.90 TRINITY_DN14748_c0_g1_i3:291-1157(-)